MGYAQTSRDKVTGAMKKAGSGGGTSAKENRDKLMAAMGGKMKEHMARAMKGSRKIMADPHDDPRRRGA